MPDLIIGVGGTGTKIVRNLTALWDATTGRPRGVATAIVDARETSPERGRVPGAVFTPVQAIDFASVYNEHRPVVDSWFPRAMAPSTITFSDGCGGVRANGKFFMFRNAHGVVATTIQSAIQPIVARSFDNAGNANGVFRVFVVGSLGNGTCGGAFMDVGALAKHLLRHYAKAVVVSGVFIPSSVTRHSGDEMLGMQVAAGGYGALLELQYEFKRKTRDSGSPPVPYSFKAWSSVGLTYTDYHADGGLGGDRTVCPIDYAYILDKIDRNQSTIDYDSLLHVAAQGLAMLAGGSDSDARLLDVFTLRANDHRAFASFGTARLRVPTGALRAYLGARQALSALDLARTRDTSRWRHLLADSTDDGHLLPAESATVASSVDFFIQHRLAVKETGPLGGGSFNQLFDRFRDVDKANQDGLEALLPDAVASLSRDQIVNAASNVAQYVERITNGLEESRLGDLVEDDDSVWRAAPTPEGPPGVRYLIEERTARFVQAGAFGALAEWLAELRQQLKLNQDSVQTHERAIYLGEGKSDEDIHAKLGELQASADGWMAAIRSRAIRQNAAKVIQSARDQFRFMLWHAKINAVDRFFNTAIAYVTKLGHAAERSAEMLAEPEVVDTLQRDVRLWAGRLATNVEQQSVAGEGLKAELFVGADAASLDRYASDLERGSQTSSAALLGRVGGWHALLFQVAAGSDAAEIRIPVRAASDGAPGRRVAPELRNRLQEQSLADADGYLADRCGIDEILVTEARQAALEYYERFHGARSRSVDEVGRAAWLREFEELVGPGGVEAIRDLDWETDYESAVEKAIDELIFGRLYRAFGFAAPQWHLKALDAATAVNREGFVNYPAAAIRVGRALAAHVNPNAGGGRIRWRPFASPHMPRTTIDILAMEVGADVDALAMQSEREAYLAKLGQAGFSPHTTSQYEVAGQRMIQASTPTAARGATFLALGDFFGAFEHDGPGNYKVKVDLGGGVIANTPMGRGLEAVARKLGHEPDGERVVNVLKPWVVQQIRDRAIGTPGVPGVGWDGVASELEAEAGRLYNSAQGEPDTSKARTLETQSNALMVVARQLRERAGAAVPDILA